MKHLRFLTLSCLLAISLCGAAAGGETQGPGAPDETPGTGAPGETQGPGGGITQTPGDPSMQSSSPVIAEIEMLARWISMS